jgi:uncharacterized membrane protein
MPSRPVRKPALRRVVTLLDRVPGLVRLIWTDLSAWTLLLTNVVTIAAAILEHWSFSTIIWVYWCQTLIIGVFSFLRAVALADHTAAGVKRARRRFTLEGRLRTGVFFFSHFAAVQLALTVVLWLAVGPETHVNGTVLLSSALMFFANHLFSYLYNRKKEQAAHKDLGTAVRRLYVRMLPLFVVFLFAGVVIASLYLSSEAQLGPVGYLVLLVMKTGADVTAHSLEHVPPRQRKTERLP